jgi:hypothetical protein
MVAAGFRLVERARILEATGPGPDDICTFGEVTFMKGHLHDLDEMFRRDGLELHPA